jgi:putative ABC transport system substrate-binding protein
VNRRVILLPLIALAACLGPLGFPSHADAQQPATPRHVGFLLVGWSPESKEVQQFRQGLLDAGYVEGRDVVIEWRSANGDYARVSSNCLEGAGVSHLRGEASWPCHHLGAISRGGARCRIETRWI